MSKVSTQDFLQIDQIREGVIVLKNKELRGILMVSSINFALKSNEEQDILIYQFQNFLNSLDFPCQIFIQSRKLNITGYLEKLKELETRQVNELLKNQTADYREFIEKLVKKGTIMSKNFFVIVPFSLLQVHGHSPTKIIKSSRSPDISEEDFQRAKNQLWQRMEFVALGLKRCGLRAIPLVTLEVIELFWGLHHPKEAETGYYPEIPPELIV